MLAVLALAATAQAQTTPVCNNAPVAGERIRCSEDAASTDDIRIYVSGLTLETTADHEPGITAFHAGEGDVVMGSGSDTITTGGVFPRHPGVGATTPS